MAFNKNSLKVKRATLRSLGVGESILAGPYESPNSCTSLTSRCKGDGHLYRQKQMLLVDALEQQVFKMYLITRIE